MTVLKTKAIASEVTKIIMDTMIWSGDGKLGSIEAELDRKEYSSVIAVLGNYGGKWNRSVKWWRNGDMIDTSAPAKGEPRKGAIVFLDDPRDKLREVASAGEMTVVKDGYFPTPDKIIEMMASHLPPAAFVRTARILEPSAGSGNICSWLCANGYAVSLDVCELDKKRAAALVEQGHTLLAHDFLTLKPNPMYGVIMMNPPFESGQSVEHVTHALKFLRPHGYLIAIMPSGISFREDKRHSDFRELLIEQYSYSVTPLPEGSFAESGTQVNTVLVMVRKGG